MTDPALNTNKTPNLLLPTAGNSMLAPQKLGSGGSATGNPRNKCALKPGHSLMDWIRLGNSGVDLAGTCGRVTPVSSEELARHNTRTDAWLALRGNVYNVTRYMDFHPGGVDELMRGVGRDATKLFDEVHAWVNYQQLLGKCLIGPLRQVVKIDADILKTLQTKTKSNESELKPPATVITEIVPRFDWIQKRADITFYIYTRAHCNPGLILQRKDPKTLELKVQIAHAQHMYTFELQQSVKWPPKALKIASESGKIEIIFVKSEAALWTAYGSHTTTKTWSGMTEELLHDYSLIDRHEINQNSFEMRLQSKCDLIMLPPVGFHVTITAPINGDEVQRSYTPVQRFLQQQGTTSAGDLSFLIKSYDTGLLSAHLQKMTIGATLQLSAPRGNFKLQQLTKHRSICLLAAGSGLTPFLSLIEPLLQRQTNRLENLTLLYFNKTEADIWCRVSLEQLEATEARFHFKSILSQPTADWTGLTGHVTKDILAPHITKSVAESATFIAICGPSAFNQKALELLQESHFDAEHVHIFQA